MHELHLRYLAAGFCCFVVLFFCSIISQEQPGTTQMTHSLYTHSHTHCKCKCCIHTQTHTVVCLPDPNAHTRWVTSAKRGRERGRKGGEEEEEEREVLSKWASPHRSSQERERERETGRRKEREWIVESWAPPASLSQQTPPLSLSLPPSPPLSVCLPADADWRWSCFFLSPSPSRRNLDGRTGRAFWIWTQLLGDDSGRKLLTTSTTTPRQKADREGTKVLSNAGERRRRRRGTTATSSGWVLGAVCGELWSCRHHRGRKLPAARSNSAGTSTQCVYMNVCVAVNVETRASASRTTAVRTGCENAPVSACSVLQCWCRAAPADLRPSRAEETPRARAWRTS